jgi:reactive intermediate/imine deaminase
MKQQINPKNSAEIMGAYSHGLKVDVGNSEMIFVTGQIAMDKDGNAVAPDDIEKQTEFVFESIQNILTEANSSLDDVVKVVIYVTRMGDFSKISPIRNKYLANSKPVSTLIEINKTVKEGCDIEIDVIAIKKK